LLFLFELLFGMLIIQYFWRLTSMLNDDDVKPKGAVSSGVASTPSTKNRSGKGKRRWGHSQGGIGYRSLLGENNRRNALRATSAESQIDRDKLLTQACKL
jgi:hypothetical protein